MRKPNFFMVGAPKCGTTAMARFLSQHPDIFFTEPKEVGYLCTDLIRKADRFHGKKRGFRIRTKKQYEKLFKDWKDEKIGAEGSTLYLYSEEAPRNIHDLNPAAKILIMIREPADFCHALYYQLKGSGIETELTFEESLKAEEQRKKEHSRIPSTIAFPEHILYTEMASFSKHIKRYLDTFGRDQVKILLFEDFKKDNKKAYQEVLDFLGITKDFTPDFKPVNVRHTIRHRRVFSILHHPAVWKPIKTILPKRAYRTMKEGILKTFRKPLPHTPMKESTKKQLKKKFKPEVERLEKLLNRRLKAKWGYK